MGMGIKHKSPKGKQHKASGVSFRNIARRLHKEAVNPNKVNVADPRLMLHFIADVIMAEGVRLQGIKR